MESIRGVMGCVEAVNVKTGDILYVVKEKGILCSGVIVKIGDEAFVVYWFKRRLAVVPLSRYSVPDMEAYIISYTGVIKIRGRSILGIDGVFKSNEEFLGYIVVDTMRIGSEGKPLNLKKVKKQEPALFDKLIWM